MSDVLAALSDDKSQAMIEVEDDDGQIVLRKLFSPAELTSLITELSRLRKAMTDPVPRKLDPNPVFTDVTRNAVFHVDRQHAIGKEFFLAARHPGFGWLAFTLEAEPGRILASLIEKQVNAISPISRPKSGLIT